MPVLTSLSQRRTLCSSSRDGQIEDTLQRAADAAVSHATQTGLACSESKSEVLLLRPPDRRGNNSLPPAIHVYVSGVAVPHVDQLPCCVLHLNEMRVDIACMRREPDESNLVFVCTSRLV
ncbi:hypothetical protein HPB50_029026 [Hyalomma asiaticum]|nr:hypothetical protein HPB50_029026 [Hyalomma asiaticum]